MKKLTLLLAMVLSCGCAFAFPPPILRNSLTTNNDSTAFQIITNIASASGSNAASGLLQYNEGNTNGGSANFFIGSGGNPSVTSSDNIGIGFQALRLVTSGSFNIAIGVFAMNDLVTGGDNTAIGFGAFGSSVAGNFNSAFGLHSLASSTSGDGNTAIGVNSLINNVSGSYNTAIGYNSGTSASGVSNIYVGSAGGSETNVIRIGDNQLQAYIAGQVNCNGAGISNSTTFTVTNTTPTDTTSLAQAKIWIIVTNAGTAYKVPLF
jgi:hypothetical protein